MLLSRVLERDESSPIESLFFQLSTFPIYRAALVVTPVPVYPASIRWAIAHHSLTLRRRMAFCLQPRPRSGIALGCTPSLASPMSFPTPSRLVQKPSDRSPAMDPARSIGPPQPQTQPPLPQQTQRHPPRHKPSLTWLLPHASTAIATVLSPLALLLPTTLSTHLGNTAQAQIIIPPLPSPTNPQSQTLIISPGTNPAANPPLPPPSPI